MIAADTVDDVVIENWQASGVYPAVPKGFLVD